MPREKRPAIVPPVLLLTLVACIVTCIDACTDPTAPPIPRAVTAAPGIEIASISVEPARDDGRAPPVLRIVLPLSGPASADVARQASVVLVEGGADAADVAAIAKNRPSTALRAREVPLVTWAEPSDAPTAIVARPTRVLSPGRVTIVAVLAGAEPRTLDLDVEPVEVARRVWPIEPRVAAAPITYCGDARFDAATTTIDPGGVPAEVRPLGGGRCVDLVFAAEGPIALPPVSIAGLLLDPEPIAIGPVAPVGPEPACPEGAASLEGLCVRLDDDRLVLLGAEVVPRVAIGAIGGQPMVAVLSRGARHVVRGLAPASDVPIDLVVRDGAVERRIARAVHTRVRRRHVVINEVLARPPSGVATQRFVELVNDGDRTVDLAGLVLVDGVNEFELPSLPVAPGGFVLVTPDAYADGLAGEVPPPAGVPRLYVDGLKLTGEIALLETDGAAISRFPSTTSTKTVSRGRRAPDRPDDAPDAFGWDAAGRATPGRANAIAE